MELFKLKVYLHPHFKKKQPQFTKMLYKINKTGSKIVVETVKPMTVKNKRKGTET